MSECEIIRVWFAIILLLKGDAISSQVFSFIYLGLLYIFLFWAFAKLGRDLVREPRRVVSRSSEAIPGKPTVAELIILKGNGSPGKTYVLNNPVTHIGRDNNNEVAINDVFASHHHARIVNSHDGYFIEDLGSTNKTYVQGKAVKGSQKIHSGETIQIGQTAFQFREL